MARILVNGEWYNELSVNSLYETEFEKLFFQEAQKIFPGYIVVNFKTTVESEHGAGKPDLALIEFKYHHWYVIEVEKSNHSFENHVLPQVMIFATAEYNEKTALALYKENECLDLEKLKTMIKGQQPKVLILTDIPKPEWIRSLSRWDAMLSVFQVFRSQRNKHIFRLNGYTPKPAQGFYSECFVERIFKRHLIISSPNILEEQHNEIITIEYNNKLSNWRRIDMQNQVVLCPLSLNPLNIKKKYRLYKSQNNTYILID